MNGMTAGVPKVTRARVLSLLSHIGQRPTKGSGGRLEVTDMVTTTHSARGTDDGIVVTGGGVDLTGKAAGPESEPWRMFVAGLIARREERIRAERTAERILALSLACDGALTMD